MNYYEQLGVPSTADAEEIRRAHRKLTKVYHPDRHADGEAKQQAEAQMRRVNAIVGILSDPQRRLEYDKQLKEGSAPADPTAARILPPKPSRFGSWRWWGVSVAAALLLTLAVVWLWLNDWGGLFKSRHPTYIAPEAADSATTPVSTTVTVVPSGKEKKNKHPSRPNFGNSREDFNQLR